MKKNIKLSLFSLCLSPLFLLTACVAPPSYTITASSSDLQLGYVQGATSQAKEEGSIIKLNAVSTSSSPFICWIKDNKTIVSNESEFELTYQQDTEGHYTAVFEETDIQKMIYAKLEEIEFAPAGATNIEYTIQTAMLTSGSNDYYDFVQGTLPKAEDEEPQEESVIYFGGAGADYVYVIKIKFKYTDSSNAETSFEYTLKTKIDKSTFSNAGSLVITENIEAVNTSIKLKFNKISLNEIKDEINVTPPETPDDDVPNDIPDIDIPPIELPDQPFGT